LRTVSGPRVVLASRAQHDLTPLDQA